MTKTGWWDWCVRLRIRNQSSGKDGRKEEMVRITKRIATLVLLWACAIVSSPFAEAQSTSPTFTDYPSYVAWMRKLHRAPFMGNAALRGKQGAGVAAAAAALKKGGPLKLPVPETTSAAGTITSDATSTNAAVQVQVNQDRNPWQKVNVAAAVDPKNPKHIVVLSDDFRDGFQRVFYHVSTDGGKKWTDDYLTDSVDPSFNGMPFSTQHDAKISFDSEGNVRRSFICRVQQHRSVEQWADHLRESRHADRSDSGIQKWDVRVTANDSDSTCGMRRDGSQGNHVQYGFRYAGDHDEQKQEQP